MYAMNYDITIGDYRIATLASVTIKASVESLASTAIIVLPGSAHNRALEIESKITRGDKVCIRLGYDAPETDLPVEFRGYVESIATDEGCIKINCEDELYRYRRDLGDKVLTDVTVEQLMTYVNAEMGDYALACDYDFRYDKFTIHNATAYDVLKKVQEETRANIYLRDTTLHIHPQYAEIGRTVIYDFAVNIEKSELRYLDESDRKVLCVVEGTDDAGKTIKVSRGTTGGDKVTLKIPGVSDTASLARRADEELKVRCYTGYEGNITGWLIPYIEPTWLAEIRDADYEYKTGRYYVVSVETSFSSSGGSRKITLGKKIG